MIKDVYNILKNLEIPVFRIYSGMQQKQRIKHLNAFQKESNCLLLATDVAARGLDIPNIQTVIHYHLPPTPTIFVHRSGRTARGGNRGLCISMVSTKEKQLYHTITKHLNMPQGFSSFPLGVSIHPMIRQRVELAREISKIVSDTSKVDHDAEWLKKNAEEADLTMEEGDETQVKLTNAERKKIRVGYGICIDE